MCACHRVLLTCAFLQPVGAAVFRESRSGLCEGIQGRVDVLLQYLVRSLSLEISVAVVNMLVYIGRAVSRLCS